ncbi:MAG: lantibiotic dehydratase, partial [Pseudonocardiaceae bacterium]
MYRSIGAALVRGVSCPDDLVVAPWPDVSGDIQVDAQRWRRWMMQVWAHQTVAEAVEVASPGLARCIRALSAGQAGQARRDQRAAHSLARYLLRLRHRATPFGMFAGIAVARIGPSVTVRWGQEHRPMARADAAWLADVISQLESCPELLHRLPVVVDPTCIVRGDRLVVPCQQLPHGARSAPMEVSVRHTPAVKTVVAAASSPISVGDLAGKLAAHYPGIPARVVDGLLAELVFRRVLLTSLRSPMTVTDGLGHLSSQLAAADAGSIAAVAATVRALREIHATLTWHADAAASARRSLRESARDRMAALSSIVEQPVTVDLRLDCSLVLPQEVAREAEKAATVLARLTPFPSGSPAWLDYHSRFLERYGIGALVPLRDLTDPDIGLGFPAGYRGSLLKLPTRTLTARDERILALAQRAAMAGTREIVLSDQLLADLTIQDDVHGPAHIDLCFHLQAPTREALQHGGFTLVVAGLASAAGATAGRFLDLLDLPDRVRLTAAYATLPTLDAGALHAQVSSPPLLARTENVSRAPAIWPTVISLAEHCSERSLSVNDLAVSADAQRLYLVSIPTGRTVEPTAMTAVEAENFTQPLARFLCEIPRARTATLGPFPWGAARRLPVLPRVRYGRTVLAPASWRIEVTDLAEPNSSWNLWRQSLLAWCQRLGVPDTVVIGDADRRLRLDLTESAHLQLMRIELNRTGHVTLREAPEVAAYGWFDGRAHEITLALASTHPPARLRAPRHPGRQAALDRDHGHLPGASPWAFVKLYGHPDRQASLLTTCLPTLLAAWDDLSEWWFVRYLDPQAHLRLRLHLPSPSAFAHAAERIGSWAGGLRRLGLISQVQWDTYYPETGRFGTGPVMAAAETVFAADSAAAIAQMTHSTGGRAQLQAVTAASI